MELVSFGIIVFAGLVIFFTSGWFTGTDEFGGVNTKDSERLKIIKQKAIVSSWILLVMVFFLSSVFEFLQLNNRGWSLFGSVKPELLYLLVAVVSYFVYYWMYKRRITNSER
ncbi:hypothetical protein CKW00_04410 [Salimicrobium humidisoli]|uniref:DUF2178 domain-containing protein n=1 Tax=Salimicrobium humidisoli TaxID=2029857 RepID=A0ABX4HST8_9BACI|nr:hypothetical protein CKW00_04410 [Salimicrobium humidisoli]